MTATDTTIFSYSLVIRDMLLAKLVTAPFFAGFTIRKSRQLPAQTNQLPFLGVYIVSEEMDKDGDINTGDIRFIHHLKIGFSVAVVNNDPEACEEKLDQAFWAIMNTLWRDPYLMNFIDTRAYPGGVGNPDNTRIEGVEKGSRRHRFGTAGLNNETPIGELQYEATVMYRAYYAPIITDDLLEIGIETVPLATDGTIPPADEVQRIITNYKFTAEPAKGNGDGRDQERPEVPAIPAGEAGEPPQGDPRSPRTATARDPRFTPYREGFRRK